MNSLFVLRLDVFLFDLKMVACRTREIRPSGMKRGARGNVAPGVTLNLEPNLFFFFQRRESAYSVWNLADLINQDLIIDIKHRSYITQQTIQLFK
jgi:hypothetical protein